MFFFSLSTHCKRRKICMLAATAGLLMRWGWQGRSDGGEGYIGIYTPKSVYL